MSVCGIAAMPSPIKTAIWRIMRRFWRFSRPRRRATGVAGAGQALSAVLLRARSENVWASFFSQPIQFDETWRELRYLVGTEFFPQLIFRLGYAAPVPATPRRPVDEVATLVPSEFD